MNAKAPHNIHYVVLFLRFFVLFICLLLMEINIQVRFSAFYTDFLLKYRNLAT